MRICFECHYWESHTAGTLHLCDSQNLLHHVSMNKPIQVIASESWGWSLVFENDITTQNLLKSELKEMTVIKKDICLIRISHFKWTILKSPMQAWATLLNEMTEEYWTLSTDRIIRNFDVLCILTWCGLRFRVHFCQAVWVGQVKHYLDQLRFDTFLIQSIY